MYLDQFFRTWIFIGIFCFNFVFFFNSPYLNHMQKYRKTGPTVHGKSLFFRRETSQLKAQQSASHCRGASESRGTFKVGDFEAVSMVNIIKWISWNIEYNTYITLKYINKYHKDKFVNIYFQVVLETLFLCVFFLEPFSSITGTSTHGAYSETTLGEAVVTWHWSEQKTHQKMRIWSQQYTYPVASHMYSNIVH